MCIYCDPSDEDFLPEADSENTVDLAKVLINEDLPLTPAEEEMVSILTLLEPNPWKS